MKFSAGRRWRCTLAGIFVGGVVLAPPLQVFDRRQVVQLDPAKSSISPNPARPGDTILITWSAVALRNCAGVVIPRIIDSTGRIFEYARMPTAYQDLMRADGHSFTRPPLTLPPVIAAGRARYEAVIIRWCNPMQEYLWPMIDKPFPIPFEIIN